MSDQTTPFVAQTDLRVRYAETDAQGIVHHAAYIVYFEEGRSEYLRQKGTSYAAFERDGFMLAVTDLQARYINASVYDEELTIRCWLTAFRSRAVTFAYEIVLKETGALRVTGVTKHICLNKQGSVVRIPEVWKHWI